MRKSRKKKRKMTEKTTKTKNEVVILNPWDSQGVQIADGTGIYPCVRGCGGGGYQQGYVLQHINNAVEDENRLNKPGHIVILNDQGGSVMDTSEDVTATLRAQDHGHPPVICFQDREGSGSGGKGLLCQKERTGAINTNGGQHKVCYPINLMVATRGGRDDMRTCFGIGEPDDPQFTLSSAHEHGVCYEVSNG